MRPGAVRIASTSFGTTGWNGQIMDAAFRNPDGSTALVVHNENDDPRTLRRRAGRRVLRLHAARRRARDVHLAWLQGARQRAAAAARRQDDRHRNAARSRRAGRNAVDDDATTRWTTGAAQQPGQYLQVDLGRSQRVRRVVLDTGADLTDYPRGYAVSTSVDGTNWSASVTGTGAGQLTTIDIPATAARFLRVVQTATAPQWWSVADLRVYR